MRMNNKLAFIFLLAASVVMLTPVLAADSETTTVTFVIPSSTDHSLSYSGSCSDSLFYFVETDASKDGTMLQINMTSDNTGGSGVKCQDASNGAFTIANDGSAAINVTVNFTAKLPTGASVKFANAYAGYGLHCDGDVLTNCSNISGGNDAGPKTLATDLAGQTGSEEIWMWADFASFNSGVATSGIARTMTTTATHAGS